MDIVLRTPAEVIEALGGPTVAAKRLGVKRGRVSMWLDDDRNCIPAKLLFLVNAALAAEGKTAAAEVFDMPVPSAFAAQRSERRRRSPGD